MVQLCLRYKIGLQGVHKGTLLFFDTHYEVIKNFPTRFLKSSVYKSVLLTSLTD